MDKTKWLYGEYEPEPIPADIIVRRIEALDDNLSDLLKVNYQDRDTARVNDILKAKVFWTKFLQGDYQ